MWKLDSSYSGPEKEEILDAIKHKLKKLEGMVPTLKFIKVYKNSADADPSNYDILLDTTFESLDGLQNYANHPDHLKVVEFMKTLKTTRSCIDYEV
jgi:hypothetical protein